MIGGSPKAEDVLRPVLLPQYFIQEKAVLTITDMYFTPFTAIRLRRTIIKISLLYTYGGEKIKSFVWISEKYCGA